MVRSCYIHIPFCKSKCNYCSFVSYPKVELKKAYLKALAKEINNSYEGELLHTIYFGGGTPSLLSVSELENVLRILKFNDITEITIEANPDDVGYDYFRGLYDLGINRVSLGCQTFDEKVLKLLNRRHNAGQVIDAVKSAQDAGFKNISLDFIYGLPGQNMEMFLKDLNRALGLGIQHISLYGLKIEEGCYFFDNLPDNLADEDMQADMYLAAVEFLSSAGFQQYEVSNFSLRGFNSKHNSTYWNNQEYYGFGVGAHGYIKSVRYSNTDSVEDYINDFRFGKTSKLLTEQDILEESIFLGFRLLKGLDISEINTKFNIDFNARYKDVLEKYLSLNLIEKTQNGYKLTLHGILVSNVILADFIDG